MPSLGFFSSRSRGPFNTGPSYSKADTSVVLGEEGLNGFPSGGWDENKIKTRIKRSNFRRFLAF